MNDTSFSFRRLVGEQGSVELTEEYIRERAYQLYEKRGRQDGHDLDDWYEAEAEILGKKPTAPAQQVTEKSKAVFSTAA